MYKKKKKTKFSNENWTNVMAVYSLKLKIQFFVLFNSYFQISKKDKILQWILELGKIYYSPLKKIKYIKKNNFEYQNSSYAKSSKW